MERTRKQLVILILPVWYQKLKEEVFQRIIRKWWWLKLVFHSYFLWNQKNYLKSQVIKKSISQIFYEWKLSYINHCDTSISRKGVWIIHCLNFTKENIFKTTIVSNDIICLCVHKLSKNNSYGMCQCRITFIWHCS